MLQQCNKRNVALESLANRPLEVCYQFATELLDSPIQCGTKGRADQQKWLIFRTIRYSEILLAMAVHELQNRCSTTELTRLAAGMGPLSTTAGVSEYRFA